MGEGRFGSEAAGSVAELEVSPAALVCAASVKSAESIASSSASVVSVTLPFTRRSDLARR
jgi:hypothetical protein